MVLIPEAAHLLGLVPLIWCVALAACNRKVDTPWWMIAVGYGVSWAADGALEMGDKYVGRSIYVILQSGLIVTTLLDQTRSLLLLCLYIVVGVASLWAFGFDSLWLLHGVCWSSVALVAWRWPVVRWPLCASFGLGVLLWFPFYWSPTYLTWGLYQGTRVCGTALLLWATTKPFPDPATSPSLSFTRSHGA